MSFSNTVIRNEDTVAYYLLQELHCDPNCFTRDKRKPLDIATSPAIIRLLLKHGASPSSSILPSDLRKTQNDVVVKLFILGNSGTGKSTLVKSLQTEGRWLYRLINQIFAVTNVDANTAGIIPHDIQSRLLGRITMFDFAGHREFYAGHDAVLKNSMVSSPSVVLLLIDLREDQDKLKGALLYWLEFINTHSTMYVTKLRPHLVLIGSHADEASTRDQKFSFLGSAVNLGNFDTFEFAGRIMLDCRYAESTSMTKLRSTLLQSCNKLRRSEKIAFTSRSFLVFLLSKFGEKPAVALSEVESSLRDCYDDDKYVYLESIKHIPPLDLCVTLNEEGVILFMTNDRERREGWIILDKAMLLSTVNGNIFAPEGFKQYERLCASPGIVSLSTLSKHFPDLNSSMIAQFLCHLEFCHEINDVEVLSLLLEKSMIPAEQFFYFPGLVQIDIPESVWQLNDCLEFNSGWSLQCSRLEQFYSPRFLQVLLLRLAYCLAFVTADQNVSQSQFQRQCKVWKNGIFWSERSGVEALVEIREQKEIIVMTRCFKSKKVKSISLRSAIIRKVLDTKKELCPKVLTDEFLLRQRDAIHYPLKQASYVSIDEVITAVCNGVGGVYDDRHQLLELENGLLHFEPYAGLGKIVLSQFFCDNRHVTVDDALLYEISKFAHQKIDDFIELFQPCPLRLANLTDQCPPGDIHKLVRVFQIWRETMEPNGSLFDLRKKLDQFSIFAGRNPLSLLQTD